MAVTFTYTALSLQLSNSAFLGCLHGRCDQRGNIIDFYISFCKKMARSAAESRFTVFRDVKARENDNLYFWIGLFDCPGNFEPIFVGQPYIHKDQTGVDFFE